MLLEKADTYQKVVQMMREEERASIDSKSIQKKEGEAVANRVMSSHRKAQNQNLRFNNELATSHSWRGQQAWRAVYQMS